MGDNSQTYMNYYKIYNNKAAISYYDLHNILVQPKP